MIEWSEFFFLTFYFYKNSSQEIYIYILKFPVKLKIDFKTFLKYLYSNMLWYDDASLNFEIHNRDFSCLSKKSIIYKTTHSITKHVIYFKFYEK